MKVYIFDIDGTLSNPSEGMHHVQNRPKNWKSFYEEVGNDSVHHEIADLCNILHRSGFTIIIVTGRSDICRTETHEWLQRNLIKYNLLKMRKSKDYREDVIVKSEIIDEIIEEGYEIVMAFEDRTRVVQMFRDRGIKCLQVTDGNY